MESTLAILGGKPAIDKESVPVSLFRWPIITQEDEQAALEVIRANKFSGTDITIQFENEVASWLGTKHAIAYCNGTMSLAAAMFGIGLGAGDEIICPTKTYWASITHAANLGATAVFCNVDEMLSMDPNDIERCITDRTKAIMVVHYLAYPCDMDAIMAIAKKHGLKVIEDVSHAQGGLYKGRRLGTFGDVGAMSMMSGKSFAAGELGMLVTNDRRIYERAMAYCHYERNNEKYIQESEDLKPFMHISLGGYKGRANQLCTAMGRVQLKYYDERCKSIREAMNYFWDRLEGVPGIGAIRVDESTGSNMAGWYSPHGRYYPEQLHGLPVERFCEALRAEGVKSRAGGNFCLHTHNLFKTFDPNHSGSPARLAHSHRNAAELDDPCHPSTEKYCFSVPWFIEPNKEWIDKYVAAIRKVVEHHMELLDNDREASQDGRWYGTGNE